MIAAVIYILLFSLVIFFYKRSVELGLPRWAFVLVFLVKVASGFFLTYIYSSHYTDRSTADIFKYYDDAKIMHKALGEKPADYFSMLSGLGNDNLYYDTTYYAKMNHWYKRNDFGNYNDNHTIIRLNALIMPFSFGSFHVHTVFMCFISFLGLFALYKFFLSLYRKKAFLIYVIVFFIPSVVFWGSGVLKEGLLLFSLGILLLSFYELFFVKRISFKYGVLLFISLFLLLINKNYLLLVILPPLLAYYIVERFQIQRVFLFFISFHFMLFVLFYVGIKVGLDKKPITLIVQKQKDFINLAKGGIFLLSNDYLVRLEPEKENEIIKYKLDSVKLLPNTVYLSWRLNNFYDTLGVIENGEQISFKVISKLPRAGSLLQDKPIAASWSSFIGFAPKAFYNSILQPSIFKKGSFVERMASLENIFILLFVVICFVFGDIKNCNKAFLWFSLFVVLIMFLIVGYTTPVAGAIVRYKMPSLPFLLMIGVNIICFEKLMRFLRLIKRK